MKAIELKDFGGPEQLAEVEIPKPVAHRGEVVVRVHATSYNPIDTKRASGKMKQAFPVTFPFIPGNDFSGTIDSDPTSIGENVVGLQPGEEVWGRSEGSYAEYMAVKVDEMARKPRNISHVEAASLSLVGQTAIQSLDRAELQAGQTILILGASGAVGSAAVQLAHLRGAKVIALATPASFDRLRSYGADQLIDYKTTPFESAVEPVDAILDGVGGELQQRAFNVLKPGGHFVAITQPPPPELAIKHNVNASFLSTDSLPESLATLTAAIESGHLKPYVGQTYQLSQAPKLWQDALTTHPEGKQVIDILP